MCALKGNPSPWYSNFGILISILIVNLGYHQVAFSQTHRENSWYRITLQTPIKENLSISTEFQHRRQNDFNNKNFNSQALTSSFRLWLDYKKNEHLTLSFSPFSYFDQNPTYNIAGDHLNDNKKEIRFATALTAQTPIFGDFSAFTKVGLEYRTFLKNPDKVRIRQKIGLNYQYQFLTLNVYNELFLNAAGVSINNCYDQNRVNGSVKLKVNQFLGFEIGYIHSDKLPSQAILKQKENIFYLNVYVLVERPRG